MMSVRPSVRPGLRPPVFHTFLQHALTYWAEILHMTFVLLYYRSSSSVVNFHQGLCKLCPFCNLQYWKYTVFRTLLLHALTYWAQIMHKTLLYCTTDQVWVLSICVNFCESYAPFGTYNTGNTQFSALFSNMLWHIELKFLHMTLLYCTTDQVRVLSICVNFCGSYAPFGTYNTGNTQFSALFSNMLWHIELKFCIWLWFTVLQIKLECRQFASIFVGVMPLL